jgi:hypothetical protein
MSFNEAQWPNGIPIERGRIVGVNRETGTGTILYSYDVRTDSGKNLEGIQCASPYFNTERGTGIYSIPDENSLCLVGWIESDQPVIIGFIGATDDNRGFKNGRPNVRTTGSHILSTRSGARMIIENAGVIQVEVNQTCRRQYVAFRDIIKDECLNYLLYTGGGFLRWEQNIDDGSTTYAQRIFANENWTESRFAEIRYDSGTGFTIQYGGSESGNDALDGRITMDEEGNFLIENGISGENDIVSIALENDGEVLITGQSGAAYRIDPDGIISMEGSSSEKISMDGGKVLIEGTEIELKAGSITLTGATEAEVIDCTTLNCKNISCSGIINSRGGMGSYWDPDKT